jgi:hypothetical protein
VRALRRGQRARPGGSRAKLKIGRYTRRETTWVKIKNPRHSQAERRRELFERRLGEQPITLSPPLRRRDGVGTARPTGWVRSSVR